MNKFISTFLLASIFLISANPLLLATSSDDDDHGGDIIYTKPLKAVIFSHKAHTSDIGLQCDWCHDETFEMEALAMEAEENFDMESLCNENYCGTCHNGDISFSTTTQCTRCHIGVKGYERLVQEGKIAPDDSQGDGNAQGSFVRVREKFDIDKGEKTLKSIAEDDKAFEKMVGAGYFPDDITLENIGSNSSAVFSHKKHTEREKLRCTECHPNVFLMKVDDKVIKRGHLTMEQMKKGQFCGSCHDGTKAFNVSDKEACRKCHPQ